MLLVLIIKRCVVRAYPLKHKQLDRPTDPEIGCTTSDCKGGW